MILIEIERNTFICLQNYGAKSEQWRAMRAGFTFSFKIQQMGVAWMLQSKMQLGVVDNFTADEGSDVRLMLMEESIRRLPVKVVIKQWRGCFKNVIERHSFLQIIQRFACR